MTTFTALDSLKEIAAVADQATPSALKALIELHPDGLDHDPKLSSLTQVFEQQIQLGGLIAAALALHEPDPADDSAWSYSDGRPIMTRVALGDDGGTFVYVHRADPSAEPRVETVRAGDGRTFRVTVVDGQVTATPAEAPTPLRSPCHGLLADPAAGDVDVVL